MSERAVVLSVFGAARLCVVTMCVVYVCVAIGFGTSLVVAVLVSTEEPTTSVLGRW